jgi:[CysO sulfur-carrier protein]-S-L-cysteine hydrolase
VRIARDMVDEMVAHAREDAPNECCGMVAAQDGRAVRVFRTANAEASPLRYRIEPAEQFRVHTEIEDAGLDLGAIYHSHTRSEPYPSQTDISLAITDSGEQIWPGTLYVIVGVAEDEPVVRAFDIRAGGAVAEVALEVEG